MELLHLCYDVLISILEEIDPADLAACAQTSWAFNNFIKDNQRLFKAHYLRNCDDPRRQATDHEPDWIEEVKKLVSCQKLLASENLDLKRDKFRFLASTVEGLIKTASSINSQESRNKSQLISLFSHPRNLDAIMYRSSLYKRAGTESQQAADNEDDQQLSAKLHCLHGMSSSAIGRRSLSTHPYARSTVYDLRNYTEKNDWGPFRDDGNMRVDWEMLESIMVVLSYNSDICCARFTPRFKPVWSEPFDGVIQDLDHVRAINYPARLPMEPDIPLEMKDPYNVSGEWHRIVCFLDYNDLYLFNFGSVQPPPDQPREPIAMEEAIRHITMKLRVSAIEPPSKFDNQDLPVVHFTGISRAMDISWDPNANSRIKGTVRLTPEGEVRWTTISIFYGGEERWRSEGIQVGGINSKRGVTGTWFDKDYDPHGPAGPTAFWKTEDKRFGDGDVDIEDEDEDESEEEWI